MLKLFGTDGVRGIANKDLTPELAFKLGFAGAKFLSTGHGCLALGRDTRISGDLLQSALTAGICAAGFDVLDLGVLPTPGLAWLITKLGANGGAIVSASHNPAEYNGIKFFSSRGVKLSEEEEAAIEALLEESRAARAIGADVGKVVDRRDAVALYEDHVLAGAGAEINLKVALDCANGAAYKIGPEVLKRLGMDVTAIGVEPDGLNINKECGSTHLDKLARMVRADGFDVGIAFDGDSDRALAVDADGVMVDGDHIMAICAVNRLAQNRLDPPAVCVTVMTNIGFDIAMRENGIEVAKTQVGDRFVLQEMLARGITMGGEQSGHVIFLDRNSTGDGIITAIELLKVMRDTGKPLAELAGVMKTFPQVLRNLRADGVKHIAESASVLEAIAEGRRELGDRGRVLVRPSGTEPVIRVMVESENQDTADRIAGHICRTIEAQI
ncbi:MAG: phosphoglucosamine mutase [Actinomycetota bacterium]|nr:phosphoglucosamine mutase [Actinomycetota bacterium]